jgi:hypothetical protein
MEKEKETNYEGWNQEVNLRNWRAWGSWFSWGSPIGLGLFFISIGIVVILFRYAFVVIR